MAGELSTKIDIILSKLEKLDVIETSMNDIQKSLKRLEDRTSKLEGFKDEAKAEIEGIKDGVKYMDDSVAKVMKTLDSQKDASKKPLTLWKQRFKCWS